MGGRLALAASLVLAGCTATPEPTTTTGGPAPTSAPTTTTSPPVTTLTDPAEVVFTNAQIITMDPENSTAEALAVDGDRIRAVGDRSTIDQFVGDETRVFDLQGLTVLPGLVDAHSHFFESGDPSIQDQEILSNGITTTAELHVTPELLETIRGYAGSGELRVRTSVYLVHTDSCGNRQGDWWKEHPPTREPGEMLRIGGIKVFADGGSCNVPAVSFTYPNGSSGDLYFTVDEMEAILREIEAEGHQAAVHALGDRALATVLDAMERVMAGGPNPLRHRIDHNAVVPPELYGRHQEAGVVALLSGAFRTCFLTQADSSYLYRTPEEYVGWEWPWRQLLDSNPETVFAWHADYPALPATLGENLAGFVTRVEGDCQPLSEMAAGTVTVEEAIEMMTLGSAYALDRDEEVGSLEPGKYADLVVLNQNPMNLDPQELGGTEALMTVVGGNVEFCRQGQELLCEVDPGYEQGLEGLTVTASSSRDEHVPERALDGSIQGESFWSSGTDPPGWIQVDFDEPATLLGLRFTVFQNPESDTLHVLKLRIEGEWVEVERFETFTATGDVLGWLPDGPVADVEGFRMTTLQSLSWPEWYEIEILR
ncbi:MAG: amidohydrolase family protein [Acidimicrobiia bacterium]